MENSKSDELLLLDKGLLWLISCAYQGRPKIIFLLRKHAKSFFFSLTLEDKDNDASVAIWWWDNDRQRQWVIPTPTFWGRAHAERGGGGTCQSRQQETELQHSPDTSSINHICHEHQFRSPFPPSPWPRPIYTWKWMKSTFLGYPLCAGLVCGLVQDPRMGTRGVHSLGAGQESWAHHVSSLGNIRPAV